MFWSAEREQRYLFTQPFLIRHQALFGRRGQPELESLDELANVRVAVQRAGLASEALHEQAGNDVTLLELDTESGTLVARSAERREGKEGVDTFRFRGSPD